MKKIAQFILSFLLSCFSVFASEKVSIFIDISGSMNSTLPEIQKYITEEYLPSLKPDSNTKIYKFYGKLWEPPIYEGNLESEAKVRWAKHQVNELAANGPWTNISRVLAFIKINCTDYGDKFIIFTDGKQELEDGSDDYELTDEIIKSSLGRNAHLVQKGKWKTVEYTYEKELPSVEKQAPIVEKKDVAQPEVEKSEKTESTLTSTNEVRSGSWKWILWVIIAIAIVALIILAIIILINALPVIITGIISLGAILGSVAAFTTSSLVPVFISIGTGLITSISFIFNALGGGFRVSLPSGGGSNANRPEFGRKKYTVDKATEINYEETNPLEYLKKINNSVSIDERKKYAATHNRHGKWTGEPGNSTLKISKDSVNDFVDNAKSFLDKEEDKKIMENYLEECNYEIPFHNGEPDFSKINKGEVDLSNSKYIFQLKGEYNENCKVFDQAFADEWNRNAKDGKSDWTASDVKNYVGENWLAYHETLDGKIQMIPNYIHTSLIGHMGLRSAIRRYNN